MLVLRIKQMVQPVMTLTHVRLYPEATSRSYATLSLLWLASRRMACGLSRGQLYDFRGNFLLAYSTLCRL